jgi:hypothetical protein
MKIVPLRQRRSIPMEAISISRLDKWSS